MTFISDIPICDWWDADYPIKLMDQFFGDVLSDSDFKMPAYFRGFAIRPRSEANIDASGKSEVRTTPESFKVFLDMSQFKPDEIDVSIDNNFVVVHAKHEERKDRHGLVSRTIKRRYVLPRDCKQAKLSSKLAAGGMLVIEAPRATTKKTIKIAVTQKPSAPKSKK